VRDSADSCDPAYGNVHRVRRANSKRQRNQYDDEETCAKRDRHVQRLAAHDAGDATDGLPEGDRWSTWDQSTPPSAAPGRTRDGWSPTWPPSTPSSAS